MRIVQRLVAWWGTNQTERDLDDEVLFHLAMRVDRHLRDGMAPDQAERMAHSRFGDIEEVKTAMREASQSRMTRFFWARPTIVVAATLIVGAIPATAWLFIGGPSGTQAPGAGTDPPFVERAAESGLDFVHVNGRSGRVYQPGIMGPGVALFDYDGDGDLDVYLVQGQRLSPTDDLDVYALTPSGLSPGGRLYRNDLQVGGDGVRTLAFTEVTEVSGIRLASVAYYMDVGTAWFDYDNDGWLDILSVNGVVTQDLDALGADTPFPLQQQHQLFRNLGNGRFADVSNAAGPAFELSEVSRGAAFGDLDNDGDTDVVVANASGPVRLLVNEVGNRHSWLGLRLVAADGAGTTLGTRVAIERADGVPLWRRAARPMDPRVLVGLGESTDVPRIRVMWPSGQIETWADVAINRYTTLTEGAGGPA